MIEKKTNNTLKILYFPDAVFEYLLINVTIPALFYPYPSDEDFCLLISLLKAAMRYKQQVLKIR